MGAWTYLFLAGFFEIFLALGLKYSHGFTKLLPSLVTVIATFLSFYCLSQAVKHLPISLAYAIWTGIGAVGVTLVGMFFLQEHINVIKLLCIVLITSGIVGLKFV